MFIWTLPSLLLLSSPSTGVLPFSKQYRLFQDKSVPLFWRIVEPETVDSNGQRRLINQGARGQFPCTPPSSNHHKGHGHHASHHSSGHHGAHHSSGHHAQSKDSQIGDNIVHTHKTIDNLRLEDIGMIGAIGDSLTAGTGAKAKNILEVLDENRGVSFTTGGEGDWRHTPSLANFFKVYNPYIQGTSMGNTRVIMVPFKDDGGGERGLNLSRSGSRAVDLPDMARDVVNMVRRYPNWKYSWKVFTILIGHNDLCSYSCDNTFTRPPFSFTARPDTSPKAYRRNVEKALDILRVNLPRTMVLLVGMADVTMILDLEDRPTVCSLVNFYECPCLFEKSYSGDRRRVLGLVKQYRYQMQDISRLKRFNTDTFGVEYLPSLHGGLPKAMRRGRVSLDLGLLAPDCFHFMSNLHGIVARNLWNNMLQPVGNKTVDDFHLQNHLVCPDQNRPFIATKRNSRQQQQQKQYFPG